MRYTITAPSSSYNRKIAGVQFIDGNADTENEWIAQWFSGRSGFTVNGMDKNAKKGSK